MASSPVLVFDIESIPDVAGLRSLRQMDPGSDDDTVYAAEIADRAARGKGDFMPLYLQRVLVISCVFRNADGLRVHSLVDRETGGASQEGRVIQSFWLVCCRCWSGSRNGSSAPVAPTVVTFSACAPNEPRARQRVTAAVASTASRRL